MESAKERLSSDLKVLRTALNTLNEALQRDPEDDVVRDAVIQRFEYVFELSWKTIQIAARHVGVACNSPRDAIQTAFKMGWIHDAEGWIEAMKARNRTSHTYNVEIAMHVYEVAKKFYAPVDGLIQCLSKL